MNSIYKTPKEAGYKYISYMGHGSHLLEDENGTQEVWYSHKNPCGFSLIYKNTHLEYGHDFKPKNA